MAELTLVSAPVSAANHRDPSAMTSTPRRAGFQPPLMVAELRFRPVRRANWLAESAAGWVATSGPVSGPTPLNRPGFPSVEFEVGGALAETAGGSAASGASVGAMGAAAASAETSAVGVNTAPPTPVNPFASAGPSELPRLK